MKKKKNEKHITVLIHDYELKNFLFGLALDEALIL